jgi:Galactose oxidase, central domain/Kelch motif
MGLAVLKAVRLLLCFLALVLAACEEGPPAPERVHPNAANEGSVSSVADMRFARAAHTATRLPGGDVLVAGGFGEGEGDPLASAELYDVTADSFAPIGDVTTPRQSHTATPLPDGRVLITGGHGPDGPLRSAEIYDPSTRRFTPTEPMAARRAGHEAVRLEDGRVLIVGGVGPSFAFLETAEVYDPLTGRFSATGAMSAPRESHTTTLLPDGRVLVSGGHVGREEDLRLYASAELYDPATGRFARADEMTMPRHKHDAVGLADGRVLIVGGADEREVPRPFDTAEIYNPETDSFRRTGNLNLARYKLRGTSILQEGGRVVVAGGADGPEVYEPATGEFARLSGSFGRTPLFAAASRARGGVLLCGGYSSEEGPTDAAWLVRP